MLGVSLILSNAASSIGQEGEYEILDVERQRRNESVGVSEVVGAVGHRVYEEHPSEFEGAEKL